MLQIILRDGDCEVFKIDNSGPEVAAITETAKLFQTEPNWGQFVFHYMVAKDNEFAGILEYQVIDDYIVITNMWINSQLLISFLTSVYTNLGVNFREVRIRDLGVDNIVLIKEGVVNENVNPIETSSVRLIDFHNLPNGSVRTTLRTFKSRRKK
mgnify:FL=1